MPRIEEYLPETEGQGPVGGLDPRTEAVGKIGAGIEKVGQSIESAGNEIYKQQAQAEVSSAAVDASQLRVNYNQRVIDETQDGSLDVNKIRQDYQDDVDQTSQNYRTAAGRNYFNRVSARIGASVVTSAAHGSAQIAGAKAAADWQTEQNANANSLYQDPSSFDDVQSQSLEGIDARVQSGDLNAAKAEKLKTEAGANNAMAAVRGWAQLGDTGRQNPDGTPVDGPSIAKHILDSGQLDGYLNPNQKEQMYGFISAAAKGQTADKARAQKVQDDAAAAQDEQWRQSAVPALVNNQLTPKAVLNSNLDAKEKLQWLDLIEKHSKQEIQSDPRVKLDITRRLLLPDGDPNKINDPQELLNKVGRGITPDDYSQIRTWYDKTPDGQALNANRKLLMDGARAKILQKDPTDPLGNTKIGYDRMAQFQVDLQNQERDLAKKGEPVGSLYDPSSPNYFGKSIGKYQKSMQDYISDAAAAARGNPPVKTQAPGAPPPGPAPLQRNAGESAANFLKRKAKAGG